jgi:ornithine decarboxylase
MLETYRSAAALLSSVDIEGGVLALRPHRVIRAAQAIVREFPGDVLYAVKCNDHPAVLRALWDGGVRHFDTASLGEIELVRRVLPDAECHFMHPVKSEAAIARAYAIHGVRSFVVDHRDELDKLIHATGGANDLALYVRLAVPGEGAVLALTGKFGCAVAEAVELVRRARVHARIVGLTFHVGSQCLDPQAYARALRLCAEVVAQAGPVDRIDVGGGFPGRYRGDEPPFPAFVDVITKAMARHGLSARLQCEPGRALVADGASVLARVELRRGTSLYLNDGVYGNLAELRWVGPVFPIRRVGDREDHETAAFDLFGPTCDSIDSMPGPHDLPADIRAGDWLEVGQMGAYSNALRTGFNGFGTERVVLLEDEGPAVAVAAETPVRLAA